MKGKTMRFYRAHLKKFKCVQMLGEPREDGSFSCKILIWSLEPNSEEFGTGEKIRRTAFLDLSVSKTSYLRNVIVGDQSQRVLRGKAQAVYEAAVKLIRSFKNPRK